MAIAANCIIVVPKENSDISANAFEGRGGNIDITTQGIFGIEYCDAYPSQLTSSACQVVPAATP